MCIPTCSLNTEVFEWLIYYVYIHMYIISLSYIYMQLRAYTITNLPVVQAHIVLVAGCLI